jgi:MATE family multidrug resistance protein
MPIRGILNLFIPDGKEANVTTGIIHHIKDRWQREGGYREMLIIAFPLILSTSSWSLQHFIDRMFLTWYSPETVAASMPAGLLNFTLISIFQGIAGYVGTFVAQYYGAGMHKRIGPAIWQGNYIAFIGGAVLLAVIPLAEPFFNWIGHDPAVRRAEIDYFKILCLGGFPVIATASLSCFYAGRGKTWTIMWINVVATGVNLIGDYLLIFGHWGLPEMGIKGAAIASVLSPTTALVLYLILFARPSYNHEYALFSGWRFDKKLFGRLLHYGLPSGVQFFLDVAGFTAFLFFVGRLGTEKLAATNIAFNINTLAFMPMIGIGIAVSILVGQNIGKNRPDLAERNTYTGFIMTFIYMAMMASLYMFVPDLFIAPYAAQAKAEEFKPIGELAKVLLRFVALYSLFDGMNIIFASAVKGAGDTRYVMRMILVVSLIVLIIPTYIALVKLHMGIYTAWTIITFYVIILGFSFFFRFLGGKWKKMKVIEETPLGVPTSYPEAPTDM